MKPFQLSMPNFCIVKVANHLTSEQKLKIWPSDNLCHARLLMAELSNTESSSEDLNKLNVKIKGKLSKVGI